MKRSVLKNLMALHLSAVAVRIQKLSKRKVQLGFLALLLTVVSTAQTTYTTRAAGNWSSATTWVGGKIPGSTIAKGITVIIKHTVTFDQNNDLSISGTLNITDTLKFSTAAKKDISVL